MQQKIGLTLSGGGARGIAHLGVIKALQEMGIQIDRIAGTSAGAIIGAFFSAGYKIDEILKIAKEKTFFGFSNLLFGKAGLFDMKAFEEVYKIYFKDNAIETLPIPLTIVATDIVNGEVKYFDKGDLNQALKASSCVPLVFQPVKYDGTILLDGGILNNFPIEPLKGHCEKIIGVHVNSLSKNFNEVHMKDLLDRSFHFALNKEVIEKSGQCDVFIEPPNMSRFGMFDMSKLDEMFEFAYQHTYTMKQEILESLKSH